MRNLKLKGFSNFLKIKGPLETETGSECKLSALEPALATQCYLSLGAHTHTP